MITISEFECLTDIIERNMEAIKVGQEEIKTNLEEIKVGQRETKARTGCHQEQMIAKIKAWLETLEIH
jgi:hypothetical protein